MANFSIRGRDRDYKVKNLVFVITNYVQYDNRYKGEWKARGKGKEK